MKTLTRYTSIEDLKASKDQLQPLLSSSAHKSDLKELISVLRNHSIRPKLPKLGKYPNKSDSGK